MAGELICPDCGGVIGATQTSEAGAPCNCFVTGGNTDVSKSDTAMDIPAIVAEKPKICFKCRKDVAGHRRVKDSRGYLCYDCAKAERVEERGGRVRCRSCGKLVKEDALNNYEGAKICNECMSERKKVQKAEIKRIGIASARSRTEWGRVYKLLIFAGVLLCIMVYGLLKRRH